MSIFDHAPIQFGKIFCPSCVTMMHFVSWDENKRGPEDAECKECGYRFGAEEVRVKGPSGVEIVERRPILREATLLRARNEHRREFVTSARLLGIQMKDLEGYVGPDSPER